MGVFTNIELDVRERRLRALLVDAARSADPPPGSEPVVLRWAGGWVRDKLLGLVSHDIDVAINSMTGCQFADHLRQYCCQPNVIQQHSLALDDFGKTHIVARQPDKSKHLETAVLRIFGLDLDFVNLRKEMYAHNSRNPQMEFGTAYEDALRRDATINALFYNLHTQKVEDYTGGLADLKNRIIRTPLGPLQTFKDDPLRVLRLVRFSARLEFSIDEKTAKFMNDPDVLDTLKLKISRERVGQELEKMLQDQNPRRALKLIDNLGLYHAIFTNPARPDMDHVDISKWHVAYDGLHHLLQAQCTPGSIAAILIHTLEDQSIAWNLAAVSPWIRVQGPSDKTRSAKSLPPVAVIAREGYRAANKLTEILTAAHRNFDEILALKQAVLDGAAYIHERDRFGMAIRRWDSRGGPWRLQVLAALFVDALQRLDSWPVGNHCSDNSKPVVATAHCNEFVKEWQCFLDHLCEIDILNAPSLKRLLDGRELAQALGVKPGQWMSRALDVCVAWQLRNPDETDPAPAIEEVKKRRKELGIPAIS